VLEIIDAEYDEVRSHSSLQYADVVAPQYRRLGARGEFHTSRALSAATAERSSWLATRCSNIAWRASPSI
jgi:hypothetical protein